MTIRCAQRYTISPADVVNVGVDYSDVLSSTELLTGTPTATELGSTHLTIGSVAATTATMRILDRDVPAAKAMAFNLFGVVINTTYVIRTQVVTTSIPAQTLNREIVLDCK